jgi:hypothetical protein
MRKCQEGLIGIIDVWNETGEEVFGSTPGMVWMMNMDTGMRALFKPDTGRF